MAREKRNTDLASPPLRDQVRSALGAWDDPDEMARSPLLVLAIVDGQRRTRGYGDTVHGQSRALREVLNQAIEALRPDACEPDATDKRWRPYLIVTERFLLGRSPGYLQGYLSIGRAVFNEEQAKALSRIATFLEEWEEECQLAHAQVTLQEPILEQNRWSYDRELARFFTGEEDLQTRFKQLVAARAPEKRLLILHGIGGVGKSSLLRMFRLHCLEQGVPVALASAGDVLSLVELLGSWTAELESDGLQLPRFRGMLEQYQILRRRLDPSGSASQMGTPQATLKGMERMVRVMSTQPGGGESSGTLHEIGVEAQIGWLQDSFSKVEAGLLRNPDQILTDCFISEAKQIADTQRLVLLLDTFERWSASAFEEQIRDIIQRLHKNILIVIAGRVQPNWGRTWPTWTSQAEVRELREMSEADARALAHKYYALLQGGIADPDQVAAILRFARGLPLAVTTAVRLWVQYAVDFEAVEPAALADTVDWLLVGVPNGLRPALEVTGVLRWFNRGVLHAVAGTEVAQFYDELRRFPFVRPHKQCYALHDTIRQLIGAHLYKHDRNQYRDLHTRAALYFSQQIDLEEGGEQEWSRLQYLYHSICADERRGMALFQEFAEEVVRLQLTYRLRSLLNDASSYPLFRQASRQWLTFYQAELARLEGKLDDAEQLYHALTQSEPVEPEIRAYALSGLGEVYQEAEWVSQPDGLPRVTRVIEQSIALLPHHDPRVASNWANLGKACGMLGRIDEELAYYERALALCEQAGDPYGVARIMKTFQDTYARVGDWPNMLRTQQRRLSVVPKMAMLSVAYIDRIGSWAYPWSQTGRYAETEQRLCRSKALREQLGETDLRILLRNLTYVLGVQDKFAKAYDCAEQALACGRRKHEGYTRLGILGYTLYRQGRYEESEQALRRSLELKQQWHYFIGYAEGLVWLGQLHEVWGNLHRATHYYQEALEYGWTNRRYYTCSALTGLVRVNYAQGRAVDTLPRQAEAEHLAQQYEYNDHLASLRLIQGHMSWDRGESPLPYYQEALIYALRYNRFLLDELLAGRAYGTPLPSIIPHCLARGEEGVQVLVALRGWWQVGVNEVVHSCSATISSIREGIKLTEAEQSARERELGDDSPQKTVLEQIQLMLT